MRRILVTALLALLAPMAAAVPAHASRSQGMTFEAGRDFRDPAKRAAAFDEIASEGIHALRVVLYWHDVAPMADSAVLPAGVDEANPDAYNRGWYDATLAEAKRRGWSVVLTVSGPVPKWATLGRRDTVTRPDPKAFQRFMTAVARRYGATVTTWAIWNEPNHPKFLMPQKFRGKPASGVWYRKLFLAGYQGLRDGGITHPRALVGETAPRGTGNEVAPLTFLRQALCLNASYKRARSCGKLPVVGYAHHAYSTRLGPFFKPHQPNDVTIGVLGRLVTALDRAGKAGALPRRTPIYLTEFGIQSRPDVLAGVSLSRQAEYQAMSERIAFYTPRVVSFSQYLLRDDLPVPGMKGPYRFGGFESGLRTASGKAKPLLRSFRIPLAAKRKGSEVSLWGLVRPATGRTKVTVEAGRTRFHKLATVTTDARGYWTKSTKLVTGRRYRVVWVSPTGTRYVGPPMRVYR
jgi:hypothetical protein